MRAFQFRLDAVLKVQQRRMRLAELRRQQALQVLTRAETEVARLQEELRQTARILEQALAGQSAAGWEACYSRSHWLGNALSSAEEKLRHATLDHTQASAHYRERATAVEVLQHLRESRWQDHKEEVAAQEQQRVEEIVLRRWQLDRAEEVDPNRKDAS